MSDYILEFINSIRPTDIIDIAIIALFIYIGLVWLRNARARFIVIGMIIVGSVYVLGRLFGLYMTTMVFQAFIAIFLIMVVVIFQDDFRHFFERIAITGIIRKRRRVFPYEGDINILSSAIVNLSRKQIGALIVVRGRDPLDRHIEAGISLDGVLNQVIVETIFDPHVPSHDGAVVIEGARITRFGCYLPLSTNISEVGRLGTRHAAALGLSERTDALCIVVSEERGTISVTEGERIKQLKDISDLEGALKKFYSQRFPAKQKTLFMEFLRGYPLEKVAAVLLAGGLWFTFAQGRDIIRRDFILPVEYRNLAAERIIGEPKPKEITITLSGSERIFKHIDPKEFKLSLDMSGVKDGENKLLITKQMIAHPVGLTSVVNIEPEEIQLNVYKLIAQDIPIELKTQGKPSSAVVIKQIKIEPQELSALVPNTLPKEQISIATEPIDLKTISETITLTPKLIISPGIRFPDNKYQEVKVIIEVEPK